MEAQLEFGRVSFCGGRKTEEPREKPGEYRNKTGVTKVETRVLIHCGNLDCLVMLIPLQPSKLRPL